MKAKLKTKEQLIKEGWSFGLQPHDSCDLVKDGEPDCIAEPMINLLGTSIEVEEKNDDCFVDTTDDAWNWPKSVIAEVDHSKADLSKAGIADSDASKDVY